MAPEAVRVEASACGVAWPPSREFLPVCDANASECVGLVGQLRAQKSACHALNNYPKGLTWVLTVLGGLTRPGQFVR
jgi:hypothetical protein